MNKHVFFGSALGLFSIVGLAACGGGGSSSAPTPVVVTPPTPTTVPSTAPVLTSPAAVSVTEGATGSFYTATASDAEGDDITSVSYTHLTLPTILLV